MSGKVTVTPTQLAWAWKREADILQGAARLLASGERRWQEIAAIREQTIGHMAGSIAALERHDEIWEARARACGWTEAQP